MHIPKGGTPTSLGGGWWFAGKGSLQIKRKKNQKRSHMWILTVGVTNYFLIFTDLRQEQYASDIIVKSNLGMRVGHTGANI